MERKYSGKETTNTPEKNTLGISNAMQGQYTNCHIIATIFGVERFENDRSRYV